MLEHKESQVYLVSKAYDGQDSRTVPTSFSQVSLTAQKGLEKYQKVYLQKLARQSAEE